MDNPDTGETNNNPDTGETNNDEPDTGETNVNDSDTGEHAAEMTEAAAYLDTEEPEPNADTAVDCRHNHDSSSSSSSDKARTRTKPWTPRAKLNAPQPALTTMPTTMCRSVRNRKPREQMNLATMRIALQMAIITTAANMFPATMQLVTLPAIFESPLSCKGLVQSSLRAKLNRPDLHTDDMSKGE